MGGFPRPSIGFPPIWIGQTQSGSFLGFYHGSGRFLGFYFTHAASCSAILGYPPAHLSLLSALIWVSWFERTIFWG